MNKKMSKRQKDMKSKLMAAICMLLVSSIMMVSTTYAWFTLSTAPEVTGITTAVGANGNLEMALLPSTGLTTKDENFDIKSGTTDSMAVQDTTKANITWGNLVDLTTGYGMDDITLYPAALNYQDINKTKLDTKIVLSTPEYGADGRVASLKSGTVTGVYDGTKFTQNTDNDVKAGVRVIGNVSGMSERQIEYRNALSKASSAAVNAGNKAAASLSNNGSGLGNIVIKYAVNSDSATFDNDDVKVLKNIASALIAKGDVEKETESGPLTDIETSIRYYAYAWEIANNVNYADKESAILGTTALSSLVSTLSGYSEEDSTVPAILSTMITKLNDATSAVNGALSGSDGNGGLNALNGSGTYTWSQISAPMSKLIDTSKATINGLSVSGNDKTSKDDIIASYVDKGGLTLNLPTGSGVYADIADFAGDYSTSIKIPGNALGYNVNIPCALQTASTVSPTYQKQAANYYASDVKVPEEGAGVAPISDYYGYIIDLAFKTNASNSYLKLQSDAIDRIYNGETNKGNSSDSTMGNGSSMTFKSSSGNFTDEQMIALMKNIKVIFFDPSDGTIRANAVLDESSKETTLNGVTMNLKISNTDEGEDNKIMELTQNTATRLSVLVYLDGENVTNADVAFDSATSMTGSLNLQFASSANLVPMVYSDFKEGSTTPSLPTGAEVLTTETVTTGYKAKVGYMESGDNKTVYALIQNTAGVNVIGMEEGGKVEIAGTEASYDPTLKVWKATVTAKPTGNVSVNITGTAKLEETTTPTTSYTVSLDGGSASGVTLKDAKVEGTTCTFQLNGTTSDKNYTVTYSMGDTTDATLTVGEDGNYTINNVTGNITIKVVENSGE